MSAILDLIPPSSLEIAYGQGNYLFSKSGVRYLDTFSGIAVNALGHNHPAIVSALREHVDKPLHLSNFFRTGTQEALATKLIAHSNAKKVFFANSGTEANEAAIKLVRKYGLRTNPDKTTILTVTSAFHGRTTGSMRLTGNAKNKTTFGPTIPGIKHVGFNDVAHLETSMDDNVCAVFLELIHGSSGVHRLDHAFLEAVMRLKRTHDFLIVVDEVQTGLMRTGTMFYYMQTPIIPDLITVAKALGGGLPLGAMLVREPYIDVLIPDDHGSTFGGNPLACTLGLALLKTIETPGFQDGLTTNMQILKAAVERLRKRHGKLLGEVRGVGYLLGIELKSDPDRLQEKALENGLLLNITGRNVLRLLPALTFDQTDIDLLENKLDAVLATIK